MFVHSFLNSAGQILAAYPKGVIREENIGSDIADFLTEDSRALWKQHVGAAVIDKQSHWFVADVIQPDGTTARHMARILPEPRLGSKVAFYVESKPIEESPLSSSSITLLELIAKGKTHGSAAEEMGITPSTLRGHIAKLKQKLDATSDVDLVKRAVQHGIIRGWEAI